MAQNLVPNPGFEILSECPDHLGQIDRAIGWAAFQVTPDLFNVCSDNLATVPTNYFGSQWPAEGEGYAGLHCYYNIIQDAREYIGIQLTSPLIPGAATFVSFKAVLSGSGDHKIMALACSGLGAKFAMAPWYEPVQGVPPPNDPDVFSSEIIGYSEWVTVSGTFIPDSAYTYLALGIFLSDENITTAPTGLDSANWWGAYYYIDDVCVGQEENVCDVATVFGPATEETRTMVFYDPSFDAIRIVTDPFELTGVICLMDLSGRVVQRTAAGDTRTVSLPANQLSSGIYLLQAAVQGRDRTFKVLVY